jgi:hypothetical protein
MTVSEWYFKIILIGRYRCANYARSSTEQRVCFMPKAHTQGALTHLGLSDVFVF